jgi:shikimate dehydrogenase
MSDAVQRSSPQKQREIIFGIFGGSVGHSLSPAMHNAAFSAIGFPGHYLPFDVSPEHLHDAVRAISAFGIGGVNITIPHKERVGAMLDRVDENAVRIGAVNTINVVAGKRIGHNTDGEGFLRSLREAGVEPEGMRVILVGAGGAALGVAFALFDAGISQMTVLARSPEKVGLLLARIGAAFPNAKIASAPRNSLPPRLPGRNLLINATPLGLIPDDPLPYPADHLESIGSGGCVADLVYRPYETPLLVAAKQRGLKTVPGIGMLLHQGALAFEIWTARPAPIAVMREALMAALV